jgi:transposase
MTWTGEGGPDAMLSWEEFVELRNLYERGWSVSAIARHLGKDRKTVRRYLTDPDARPGVRKPTGRLLDPYAAYVQARLEDNPHLAGTVLDRELGELGFAGSYRTLARHLAGVRPDCPACHGPEPAERSETPACCSPFTRIAPAESPCRGG